MIKTNHLEKRYQVFISSTLKDLKKERQDLRSALIKNNFIVEGMENFPATNMREWKIIKERIDKSDIFVLIIGDKYGSIAENAKELESDLLIEDKVISYTHLEFRYAKQRDIPILAFVKSKREDNDLVNNFVKEVQKSKLTTDNWKNETELVAAVTAGLNHTISEDDFKDNNGWVKVKSLNTPIDSGDKSIYLESKIHYVKFVSYSNKKVHKEPLYKKFIKRLNKEVDVWDEYITCTISQFSHFVDQFQFYSRTDGDAVDLMNLLPFENKFTFSDINEGIKDTIFNPLIKGHSNVYVSNCCFINGFQDGNTDMAVKASHNTKHLRLLVDFTSIPEFENIFLFDKCIVVNYDQSETVVTSEDILIQPGVYLIDKTDVQKNSVLKFNFKLK